MDQDMVDWVKQALDLVDDAKRRDALVMFRYEDFNIIVTNAKEPDTIRRLADALYNLDSSDS